MKRTLFVALCLVVALATGAASAGPAEFRVAVQSEPVNFSSFAPKQASERPVLANLFNGLVTYDPNTLEIVPELAESYTISRDGKVYTFKLRRGVQFHKGFGELTSEDVKFTIEAHLDPKWKSAEKAFYSQVKSVEAVDRYTVKITLTEPSAAFMSSLAWQSGLIMCKKAAEQYGDTIHTNPIGTGAFYLDKVVRSQEVALKAFDQHFRGRPILDRLVYVVVPDETVAINAVAKGEIDAAGIQQPAAYRLAQMLSDKVKILEAVGAQNAYIFMHHGAPPTNDQRVRQALAHAINWDEVTKAFGGFLEQNQSFFNKLCAGYSPDERSPYKYDLAKAKSLLEAAGVPRPKLSMIFTTGEIFEPLAQVIKGQLAPVADVELVQVDRGSWVASWTGRRWNLMIALVTRYDPHLFASLVLQKGSGLNVMGYTSPEVDRLIAAGAGELDPVERAKVYQELQKKIWEDLPLLNAGTVKSIIAVNPKAKGIASLPYTLVIDFHKVSFEN